ncbi:MAG: YtxH domain-containing protein, partial [Gemmatimonadaceae bacterium]|nr:YtxH domain-containing protein [Gemmatimonadaceae bacterium]
MARYDLGDDEPYVIIEKQEGSVGSLLLGIAIGAGVALLFAPRSGEETRADLRRRARDATDAARAAAQDVMDTAVGAVEEGRR